MYASHGYVGMPVTSVRELRVLQQCKHPNLVELKRVVTGSKLDRCTHCMVHIYLLTGIAANFQTAHAFLAWPAYLVLEHRVKC